jgi:hypothetical protein
MPTNETEIPFGPSTIETIDYAVFNWVNEVLNVHSETNRGFKKVPVVWVSAERSFQIKNNVDLRETTGVFSLPVITLERTNMVKSLSSKGSIYGNVYPVNDDQGGSIAITKQINQYKSSNFINADSARSTSDPYHKSKRTGIRYAIKTEEKPKIVYETITIPIPVYVNVSYTIGIKAEFQQQFNQIITPFMTRPAGLNYVSLNHERHVFEGFLGENFAQSTNASALEEEERRYESNIDFKVLGYLIGDDKNQITPRVVRRQNFVDVKIPREHVILGDIPEHTGSLSSEPFYRE